MIDIPRESVEFVAINIDKPADTSGLQLDVIVTPAGSRPAGWQPIVVLDGAKGVMVQSLDPGYHDIWLRAKAGSQTAVVHVESIHIS